MSYLQNLKYEIHGSEGAPRLVFLHGLMGSAANWRKVVFQMREDFQILIFDQRGHGRSFQPASGYSPEDYAGDLKGLLDELGWRRIHLVGHSMGGRNALSFSYAHGEYLESLVIEDIGPEGNPLAMDRTLRLLDLVPTPFPDKQRAKAFFQDEFPPMVQHHPQAKVLSSYFLTNIEEKEDKTADWRFYKDGIIESLKGGHFSPQWEATKAIKCPCLWIRGEFSDDLPKNEFERVLAANPIIEGVEVGGAGHWVHFDKVTEFIGLLKNFLLKASPL